MRPASTADAMAAELREICFAVTSENGAMPPGRWQPAHFSAMTGATSRVKLGTPARAFSSRAIARAASGTARATVAAAATTNRVELRMLGVICTPKIAEDAANLADRAAGAQCLAHGREEIRVGASHGADLVE